MKKSPTVRNKRILSFIPYKHVIVKTTLSLKDAVDIINGSISPTFNTMLGSIPPNAKKFQGEVSEKGFKIRITDPYRGSLTYVVGKFISETDGLKIEMFVDPNPIFLIGPVFACIALFVLVVAIIHKDYILAFGSVLFAIFLGLGHIVETDTMDWFIGNIFSQYLVENKK